jgi:hypothetical protein
MKDIRDRIRDFTHEEFRQEIGDLRAPIDQLDEAIRDLVLRANGDGETHLDVRETDNEAIRLLVARRDKLAREVARLRAVLEVYHERGHAPAIDVLGIAILGVSEGDPRTGFMNVARHHLVALAKEWGLGQDFAYAMLVDCEEDDPEAVNQVIMDRLNRGSPIPVLTLVRAFLPGALRRYQEDTEARWTLPIVFFLDKVSLVVETAITKLVYGSGDDMVCDALRSAEGSYGGMF